jgi:hypothetical protein
VALNLAARSLFSSLLLDLVIQKIKMFYVGNSLHFVSWVVNMTFITMYTYVIRKFLLSVILECTKNSFPCSRVQPRVCKEYVQTDIIAI